MSNTLAPPGLTLTQARRAIWPFNRNRGLAGHTLGELLDTRRLTRRDLKWAAANARSLNLQNACRAILNEAEASSAVKGRPIRWQDLIPPDFAPQAQDAAHKQESIPSICPVCGSTVQFDARWTTPRRAGWRCEVHGLTHFLEAVYLPMLKAVYAADAWVIPPDADGSYPGVRRRDLAKGPMGYWPEANG